MKKISVQGLLLVEAALPFAFADSTPPEVSIIVSVYKGDRFIEPFLEDTVRQKSPSARGIDFSECSLSLE